MTLHRTIVAGTALALIMTAPVSAAPLASSVPGTPQTSNDRPLILAQASIEELRLRLQQEGLTEEERQSIQSQIDALEGAATEEAPAAEEEAPAEEPAAEEPAAEEPPAEEAPVEEAPEQPAEEAPAAEEQPAEEAAPAEEPAPEEAPAEEPAAEEEQPEAPAAEETAPAEEEAPGAEEEAPAEEPVTEEAPAEEAPATEEEAPAEEPAVEEEQTEQPAAEEETAPAAEEPADEAPASEEEAPAEQPAADEAPAEEAPAEEAPAEEAPAAEEPAAEQPAAEEPAAEEPAAEEAAPAGEETTEPEQAGEGEAAPVLDSQKEPGPAEAEVEGEADADAGAEAGAEQEAEAEQAPPPESDAAAQAEAIPAPDQVESATAAEGNRIEESQAQQRFERRSDAEVIGEIAGRVLMSLAGRPVVRSYDYERLRHRSEEVYYEELPRGHIREVIVRRNGARVVTIRNRYGDIVQRSRITPDGREYILVYAGDRDRDDDGRIDRWRDPGRDLPPLRLRIPVTEYILVAEEADDPDVYYEFLDQPPVEPVRRLYSVDEVKYSARIRDTMRRVDLDNITFEFGSAEISESEITKLEDLANAMGRMLEENPAETFLIEGHTDAVGTEQANLSLSDRRAETVARALTDVFEIPPENLVTQGYGETYLKVNTEEPNRDNRRVAVRRITPLVTPVASR